MDKSSIAVVIASYNAGRFLDVTLHGVAWQTMLVSEVIIIDDCSTDETKEIVNSWLDRLPIKYIRNEVNVGVGASRNIGLKEVQSSLVAILDADDLWLPMHLETLIECLDNECTIVSPRAVLWPGGAGLMLSDQYAKDAPESKRQFKELAKENYIFGGALFPTALIREIGGYPQVRIGEDHLLWLKAVARGYLIVKPETSTVLYRRHVSSLSAVNSNLFKSLQQSFQQNIEFFDPDQQKLLKGHIKDLKMRELLSLHDERSGTFANSVIKNLVPVICRGSFRLKFSAIARLLFILRKPYHQ